ncbi:lipid II:glycine glycyltransferase FemX [Oleidesulfovibrio sp.]|uniref:lipid II:glycine glycyltransferase FemX n=1 Tax=Oleidesulfovibrio sp. TaxID=2909707 RepID=UPI003A877F53
MINLSLKNTSALYRSEILFQTPYWAEVKNRLGLGTQAYDISGTDSHGDMLVIVKQVGKHKIAMVPQGPEKPPAEKQYGVFLENLSFALTEELGPDLAFIRYDLPWESLYADEMKEKGWTAFPEPRVREMRMNFGTECWNIRKSFEDMTVASSLVVDIGKSEDEIFENMKPKTRYNIRLAIRKGVTIRQATIDNLPDFHNLYHQTAQRNRFSSCDQEHFIAMFHGLAAKHNNSDLLFLLAQHGADILAGAIIGISETAANFLYGASGNIKRNYMASSLMHWRAMQLCSQKGCTTYEMGAVPPNYNPAHPFHGLYRFKTGFGGRVVLRCGSWDFPVNQDAYRKIVNAESLYREQ